MAAYVSLIFKFFNVESVTAGIDSPVNVARVIAWCILTVFGELSRKAVIGASVNAFTESLNDNLSAQLHRLDFHQGNCINHTLSFRVKCRRFIRHWIYLSLTDFNSLSTNFSITTPSASAR